MRSNLYDYIDQKQCLSSIDVVALRINKHCPACLTKLETLVKFTTTTAFQREHHFWLYR